MQDLDTIPAKLDSAAKDADVEGGGPVKAAEVPAPIGKNAGEKVEVLRFSL